MRRRIDREAKRPGVVKGVDLCKGHGDGCGRKVCVYVCLREKERETACMYMRMLMRARAHTHTHTHTHTLFEVTLEAMRKQ